MKRFLITTPLEATWKQGTPLLLLGAWCLKYPRKVTDLGVDAEVMPYHWDDRSKMFKDYKYICSYYEIILEKLACKLNELHNVDHSLRYWRILVGPWLGLFMLMLFDRWESVRQAAANYDISGSIMLKGWEESFTPNDMQEFNKFFPSDEWNHHIYGRILEHVTSVQLSRSKRMEPFCMREVVASRGTKIKMKQLLRSLFSRIGHLFSHAEDALFLATSLTMKEETDLSARLGQFPRLLSSPSALKSTPDFSRRNWALEGDHKSEFEVCLNALLPQQIPSVYLEGYKSLVQQTQKVLWPQRPKVIWTSSVHSDDVFKAWAADKVERGSSLVVGQHGGHFGIGLWNWGEQHEMAISDRYWTWGWSQTSSPKLVPVGKIKYSHPVNQFPKNGSALLVTMATERYGNATLAMHTSSQWLDYLQDQFAFVDALPAPLQTKLIVRLYRSDYGWYQVERWRDRFPALKINDGTSDMKNLIGESRLYISTYNATTYLESLSMNMPTVIYWNPRYSETNDLAQPYFDELRSVGIFHDTPQSAAQHVTKIWDDIPAWWTSPKTRAVRDRFVRQFAYCPEDKIGRLKNAINEVMGQC